MLPASIGPYRIEARLGEGGMGVVYRAVGPAGTVALKVLRAALSDEAFALRFAREAVVRVAHPNVARVLDASTDAQGTPYIAFEHLEGETLAEVFAGRRPTTEELVDWGGQAARGLAAAHAASIVHRDVKPSNLFLCEDGTLKLLDFGIALVDDDRTRLTRTGAVPGTVGYLAPEQAEGHIDVDGRADQWALAAVLYEGISGAPPFARPSPLGTIVATLMADLTPLREQNREVPKELARVIERALSRKPDARFSSMEAFAAALEGADLKLPTSITTPQTGSMRPGERRVIALLFAVGVRDADALSVAVERERGSFNRLAGERALAVFGDASWEGDEVARAARVAVDARGAADFVGVTTGWATSTGVGLSGEALDAAERCVDARLAGIGLDSQAARHLLDSHTVERVADGIFELRPGPTTSDAGLLPLIGRDAEIAQLRQAFEAVIGDGRAGVTIIEGPLGIGKGRLLSEACRIAAREVAGIRIVTAGGTAPTREADLSLIRRLIVELLGPADDASLPTLRRALADAIGGGPVATGHAEALAELLSTGESTVSGAGNDILWARDRSRLAIMEWLRGLSARAPLLLCVPELHWADDASVEILEELVEACEELPLFILGTLRPELATRRTPAFAGRGTRVISPKGLTRRDTAALSRRTVGEELSEGLVARLHERSAGNPYFIIQSVRALAEHGALDEASSDALPLPATVEAAVQSRLDHLDENTRAVCRDVSVWDRPFSAAEATAVVGVDAAPHLERLAQRDLLTIRGRRSRLMHRLSPLVREVAYRSLGETALIERHRRAAAYLASDGTGDAEERGRHHERAGELVEASQRFAEAAFVAIRRGDAHTALRCAERALEIGVPRGAAFDLHALRLDALRFLGRHEAHGVALTDALSSAGDDRQRARALSEQAVWLWRRGRLPEAVDAADAAVTAARSSGDREALVLARGRQSLVFVRAARGADAEEALAEAVRLSEGQERRLRATVLSWRAHHLAIKGALSARISAYVELAELYEELGDIRRMAGARANLADVYNRLGAYEAAAEALESAIADCRRVGHRTMEGYSLANLAYARTRMGRAAEAVELLAEATKIADETLETRLGLLSAVYRAAALLTMGRASAAVAAAEAVAEVAAEGSATRDLLMNALAVASEAHRQAGELDEALDASARALACYDALGAVEEGEADVLYARFMALSDAGCADEAEGVRKRARARLLEVANAVTDPELREGYLSIPIVAALVG